MSTINEQGARLTPYDTGKRAEPKVWLTLSRGAFAQLEEAGRKIEEDRFGRVDFDDDEGTSLATVWVERDEHGQHVLHIQQLGDEVLVAVHG